MAAGTPFPTYSHGGLSVPGFPAASSTTTGPGRPIFIGNSIASPAMNIICLGGTATVFLEANGGQLDQTGNPPSGEWVDMTGGSGYAMTSGQTLAKLLSLTQSYYRTRISAISGATVLTYVPLVILPTGTHQASYPPIISIQSTS